MVAAVAEISHLRTACSYHAEPFVTMVALRPIFRPIGAAAPAFGPYDLTRGAEGKAWRRVQSGEAYRSGTVATVASVARTAER